MGILSFSDRDTERLFTIGTTGKGVAWVAVGRIARRKLDMIHYAVQLKDLQAPPGNRLEPLKGALAGFYSIRINDQWRVVFRWSDRGAAEVRITDYHQE